MTAGRMLRAAVAAMSAAIVLGVTAAPAWAAPVVDEVDPVQAAEYWLDDYGIREAWQTTRGEGVTIAIIDTGIAKGPAEFQGAVAGGYDVSGIGSPDGRTPVGAVDRDHGSWVASLAASRGTGGGAGMLGVAPEAKLLSVSVGFGTSATRPFADQIAEAMVWAVDNGADIINLSIADDREVLSYEREAIAYAQSKDVVVVAGAGNRNEGHTVIGAYGAVPGVLCVAATGPSGKLWPYSVTGDRVALAAPGQDIVSTGSRRAGSKTGYVSGSGTSFATAVVSGAAALVRSKFPDLSAADVINRLIATATDAGAPGRDDEYGFGRLDLRRALTADVAHVETNPLGDAAAASAASEQGDDDASRPDDRWGWGFYLLAALALCLLLWVVVVTVMVIVIRRRRSPPPPPPYPPGAGPYFGPHPTGVPPSPAGAPSIAPYPQAPPGGPPPTGQPPFRST